MCTSQISQRKIEKCYVLYVHFLLQSMHLFFPLSLFCTCALSHLESKHGQKLPSFQYSMKKAKSLFLQKIAHVHNEKIWFKNGKQGMYFTCTFHIFPLTFFQDCTCAHEKKELQIRNFSHVLCVHFPCISSLIFYHFFIFFEEKIHPRHTNCTCAILCLLFIFLSFFSPLRIMYWRMSRGLSSKNAHVQKEVLA